MRITSKQEVQSVLRLSGPERYEYFVKRVAAWESAWSLWRDGWGLMAGEDGKEVFPLWPAVEYAKLHQNGDWERFEVREIPLRELLDVLLPLLKSKGMLVGVFPTPNGMGVAVPPDGMLASIHKELQWY